MPISPELAARFERATVTARREVRRGQVLVAACRAAADAEIFTTHCAWCDRHLVGGHWLALDELPPFGPSRSRRRSHGICPRCIDDLRARGLSR